MPTDLAKSSELAIGVRQVGWRVVVAKLVCDPVGMDSPDLTQEQRYERIAQLRERLDEIDKARAEGQDALHQEIQAAFPERRGEPEKRGVLAEISRRSRYSREHVAQIRDGKAAGGTR